MARDLGAALGDTNAIAPRKNHAESFEKMPFILGVDNGHVEFAYNGWYKNLVRDRITPEEVAWASALLGRLSDKQWADAFRAGGYEPDGREPLHRQAERKDRPGPLARRPRRGPRSAVTGTGNRQ